MSALLARLVPQQGSGLVSLREDFPGISPPDTPGWPQFRALPLVQCDCPLPQALSSHLPALAFPTGLGTAGQWWFPSDSDLVQHLLPSWLKPAASDTQRCHLGGRVGTRWWRSCKWSPSSGFGERSAGILIPRRGWTENSRFGVRR